MDDWHNRFAQAWADIVRFASCERQEVYLLSRRQDNTCTVQLLGDGQPIGEPWTDEIVVERPS